MKPFIGVIAHLGSTKIAGQEIFVFDVKKPLTNKEIKCNLGKICIVDEVTLEIEVDKTVTLNQIFEMLNSIDIDIISVKTKTNKLEKLFIEIAKG